MVDDTLAGSDASTFSCAWSHPDCANGPGENHWRHVPLEEMARLAPAWYLLHLPIAYPAVALGLTTRLEERPELLERLVIYAAGSEEPWSYGWRREDWLALLDWLLELPGGGTRAVKALLYKEKEDPVFTARLVAPPRLGVLTKPRTSK